jgi:hypothetical protein
MAFRALSTMDVKSGLDAGDPWSANIDFDRVTRLVTLECWDEPMDVMLSNDGTNFGDPFEIDPSRPLVLPFAASTHRVKNTTVGDTARYQTAGME